MRLLKLTPLVTLLFLGAGSGLGQTATEATAVRWIVYGLDATGSYALVSQAQEYAAQQLARDSRPGDVWFFRRISDRSYDESAAILTVRLPSAPAPVTNPFDRASRARQQAAFRRLEQVRRAAADQLRAFRAPSAPCTDIMGFLAKAGELLQGAPKDAERIVIIASDLADNIGRKAEVNLAGTRVIVNMFQGGANPQAAQGIRRFWRDRLTRWGAREVSFLDPSQALVAEVLKP